MSETVIQRENVVIGAALKHTMDNPPTNPEKTPKTLKESEAIKREKSAIAGMFINFGFGRVEGQRASRPPFGVLRGEIPHYESQGVPDGSSMERYSYDGLSSLGISQLEQVGADLAWTLKLAIREELQAVREKAKTEPEDRIVKAYERLRTLTQTYFTGFDHVELDEESYDDEIDPDYWPEEFIVENVRGILQFMYPTIEVSKQAYKRDFDRLPTGKELEGIGRNSFSMVADHAKIHIMDQGSWPWETSQIQAFLDDPRFYKMYPLAKSPTAMINPDTVALVRQGDGLRLTWGKIDGTDETYFQHELKQAQERTHQRLTENTDAEMPETLNVVKCAALLSSMSMKQTLGNTPEHRIASAPNALQGLWNMYLDIVGTFDGTPT